MSDEVYERLANALDRLPNRFPRTKNGVEIEMLKAIYDPDEAAIGAALSVEYEQPESVAERAGVPLAQALATLRSMRRHGLVWPGMGPDNVLRYRLAPFIVGAYEGTLDRLDHRLAHLMEEWANAGGLAGIMRPGPALHRVVPAHGATKSEWILPYDDVRSLVKQARSFNLRDCICRKQQALVGNPCKFPLRLCLSFSTVERPRTESSVTMEQALAALEEAERIGLVHTVSNVAKGVNYVCNCCGCCCGILRGITQLGIQESVAYANYYSEIDRDGCSGCGTCAERCQVGAISIDGDAAMVDRSRCIGCGLCVTGCESGAAVLRLKPEAEIVEPPADFGTWERERERRRHSR
jgi:ferredoxin